LGGRWVELARYSQDLIHGMIIIHPRQVCPA
jgi:hypothetical protein